MAINIRPMTRDAFETAYRWSAEHHAKELVEQLHMPEDQAAAETIRELAQMFPDGMHTRNVDFLTIADEDGAESAGFLWLLYEEFEGRKQCFICDLAVWESKRRRGYALAALRLAERHAAAAGCIESVLFVSDDNVAAIALYEKSGYAVLRRNDTGAFMIKQIS